MAANQRCYRYRRHQRKLECCCYVMHAAYARIHGCRFARSALNLFSSRPDVMCLLMQQIHVIVHTTHTHDIRAIVVSILQIAQTQTHIVYNCVPLSNITITHNDTFTVAIVDVFELVSTRSIDWENNSNFVYVSAITVNRSANAFCVTFRECRAFVPCFMFVCRVSGGKKTAVETAAARTPTHGNSTQFL